MSDVDEVEFQDLIQTLTEYWLTVVCIGALGAAAAISYVFVATPYYKASALTSPVSEADSNPTLAGLAGRFGSIADLVGVGSTGGLGQAEAIATLKSRSFLTGFIESHELLPDLFNHQWNSVEQEWDAGNSEIPSLSDGYDLFSEQILKVDIDRSTKLITISVIWKEPDVAARWTNELITEVNALLQRRAIDEANRIISFLHVELESTSGLELKQLIFGLIESQINKITIANAKDQFAFKIIDPAVPPDKDDFIRPKPAVTIISGAILGVLFGCCMAFYRRFRAVQRVKNTDASS